MFKNKCKILNLLFLSLIIFGLIGITGVAQNEERFGGTATVALTTNPITPDPIRSTSVSTRILAAHIFESLATYDENYRVMPQLAESWEHSENLREWTFHLREGVTFHNGSEMSAEDVKASIDRFIESGARKEDFSYVEEVQIVDKYTVKITTSRPVGTLPQTIANPATILAIMPKEICEKNMEQEIDSEEAIGTGPYELVTYSPDVEFVLEKFEDYSPNTSQPATGLGGEKIAYFEKVIFKPVPESSSRVAGLETGEYDMAQDIPYTSYRRLRETENVDTSIVKPKWGIMLELNHTNTLKDLKIRRAIQVGLNMEQIMEVVTEGREEFYRLQPGYWAPEISRWHSKAGSEYYNVADKERAKELLDEAGYDGEKVTIISNRDYSWMYKTTLAVVPQLKEMGINAEAEFYDWTGQLEIARSLEGYDINQSGWSPRIPPSAINVMLKCGSMNAYGYCNDEVDDLLDRASETPDPQERADLYEEVQEKMYEDVAKIRIGDLFTLEATASNLEGYESWYVIPRMWNVWREG